MIALTDTQLSAVMTAAPTLPVEKRDLYLRRIAAMLALRGRGHFTPGAAELRSSISIVAAVGTLRKEGRATGPQDRSTGKFSTGFLILWYCTAVLFAENYATT